MFILSCLRGTSQYQTSDSALCPLQADLQMPSHSTPILLFITGPETPPDRICYNIISPLASISPRARPGGFSGVGAKYSLKIRKISAEKYFAGG